MWQDVKYTREAVLDADNVEIISARAARQVDKLISVPRYDVMRLITKLRGKCSVNSVFDWGTFGVEVGSCFNAVPCNVSFLNGPIDAAYEPKLRKKVERRKATSMEDKEETVIGNVQQKKRSKDEDKLSAAEKQVVDIQKMLNRMSEDDKGEKIQKYEEKFQKEVGDWDKSMRQEFRKAVPDCGEVCGVQFLFNPKSFTQTVENIFGLSFLVKKGDVQIGVRKPEDCHSEDMKPGLFVKSKGNLDGHQKEGYKPPPATQAIVSLSMQDWRAMVEAYNVKKSDLPHRGKSKYAKTPKKK